MMDPFMCRLIIRYAFTNHDLLEADYISTSSQKISLQLKYSDAKILVFTYVYLKRT